jgi:cell division septal protein FtsQ
MSPRPRRKKRSPAARLRPFWFLLVLIALAAGFGAYYAATWPGFDPKSVTVSGNRVVPAQEIASRAHISRTQNVWLQSMGAAADRVAAIPYIRTVSIHRGLPASVRVAVTERTPYAKLRYGTQTALVDRDLRVLQMQPGPAALPVFAGTSRAMPAAGTFVKDPDIARLREDYEALSEAHVVVAWLEYDKFGDLVATMRSGVQLLLGDDKMLEQTAPLVGPILSQVAASGRKIAQVDLRAPKTPVVVFKK